MSDLVAFLSARLDEDEAAANAAASVAGPGWKYETYWPEDEGTTRTCVRSETDAFLADLYDAPDYPDLAAHIARHDPARVLREVEAGRKILAMYRDAVAEAGSVTVEWLLAVVETKAAVYREHPDYDPAWAI